MSEQAASSVPDGSGFSVESIIETANRAWDEPEDSPSGTDNADVSEVPPATGAESSVAEQPTPEVFDRGDGRDPKGRFAPKGGKQEESTAAAEAPAPATPAPTQAPSAEATPETPPEQASEQAAPFSVRYGGKDYGIEGAVSTGTHLVIPIQQQETVSRYIGMGLKYEAERETVKRDRAQLSVDREMFTAETGPVMEEVKRLFEIASLPDDDQFAQAFSQYAWELRNSLPMLKERMELSKSRQQLEIEKRMMAPDPEVQAQQIAHTSLETAAGHLQEWKQDPQTKPLTKEDWQWVEGRVQKDPLFFLQRAGQRLTPEEQESGVQPGEVYFSTDKLLDLVTIRLELRKDLASAAEAQKRAVAIAKENAVRNAAGSVPPPPSGRADTAPVKEEENGTKKYGSMAELRKDLGVGW